jgi:hypothetical protein
MKGQIFSVASLVILIACGLGHASAGLSSEQKSLTAAEICQRLKIVEEVLVFDASGERIIDSHSQVRDNRGALDHPQDETSKDDSSVCSSGASTGQTSSSFEGPIFFNHVWTVLSDGRIKVTYEQGERFEGRDRDAKLIGSTGRKELIIKDLSAVSWISPLHQKQRVVVRLVPTLDEGESIKELGNFPVTFDNAVIYDGTGKLWAVNLTAEGEYIAMTTVHGGLLLSYQPFPGGKKIGRASGKQIKFKTNEGVTILIKSESPILPGDIASDVYVLIDLKFRSGSITSQSISSGKNADEVMQRWAKHSRR